MVALEQGWSRDILAFQVERRLHQRTGKAISNFRETLPEPDSDLAQQATRDPYLFDFLSTTQTRIERDMEQCLVDHVRDFLLELGRGFAFVGNQVRLELGDQEFYCDLLFFHTELRCYVVIELKAVAFDASHLGQLGLYLAAVDDFLAHPGDNPTIGLLLCKKRSAHGQSAPGSPVPGAVQPRHRPRSSATCAWSSRRVTSGCQASSCAKSFMPNPTAPVGLEPPPLPPP